MPIPEGESRERVYMHLLKGVLMPILSLSPEPMDNYLSRRQIAWALKPCGPHYCDLRIKYAREKHIKIVSEDGGTRHSLIFDY